PGMALSLPNDQWRLEHRQTPLGSERVAVHPQTGVAVRIHPGPLALIVRAAVAQLYADRIQRLAQAEPSVFLASEATARFLRGEFEKYRGN
ncbi:MAG: hypothetical protein SFV23_00850, partial [Planctomycetaceae bacterium]|nr:hypothetical protein [Planctomycetaceae bacterium]